MPNPVAVEKGTKAVISENFSVDGGRTFNSLTYERISLLKIPQKQFFQQPRLFSSVMCRFSKLLEL